MNPRRALTAMSLLAAIALASFDPAGALAGAETTIGTETAPRSGWEFGSEPYSATVGETITVPAGVSRLTSFTLYPGYVPTSFAFRAYVYAWTGTQASVTALYESEDLHTTGVTGFQTVTVDTAVPVLPGHRYVLFLSRAADQGADEGIEANGAMGTVEPERMGEPPPYQEGGMVNLNNGYRPSEWTTRAWLNYESEEDLAFQATFDVPPVTSEDPVSTPPVEAVEALASTAAPAARCVTPDLGGLSLAEARQALKSAGCALGKVVRHYFTLPKGEVMEQDVHRGTFLPAGGRVDVWISRGAHIRHHERVH